MHEGRAVKKGEECPTCSNHGGGLLGGDLLVLYQLGVVRSAVKRGEKIENVTHAFDSRCKTSETHRCIIDDTYV